MKIYHKFFLYQNKLLQPYVRLLLRLMAIITYLASIMLIVGVIYEHGFTLSAHEVTKIHLLYKTVWIIFLIDVTLHILLEYRDTKKNFRKLAWILSWLLYLTLIPVIFHRPEEGGAILHLWEFLHGYFYHIVLLLLFSLLNLSNGLVRLLGRRTNPSLILAASFLVIILIGAGLLMLPRCTVDGVTLSWVDALFTSTSAVCVTGLVPVDVSATFTPAGLTVIILLIQIGGLGVMTLTSFFAMFFMGNTSLYNQLVVRDMVSSNSLGSLLSTLLYILGFTLVIEGVGMLSIWFSIHGTLGMDVQDELAFCSSYFSLFHSPSSDNLQVVYDVDSSLLFCGIIRNLLQPVIENYFVHGFDPSSSQNHIIIRCAENGPEYIKITIIDDGFGINANRLEEIRAAMNASDDSGKQSYGLKNLARRIQLFYGPECGLSIGNNQERGVCVSLKIRRLSCEQHESLFQELSDVGAAHNQFPTI